MAYNIVVTIIIGIRLAVVGLATKCEIPRKFELIARQAQGHPRSSILLSIESTYATLYHSH